MDFINERDYNKKRIILQYKTKSTLYIITRDYESSEYILWAVGTKKYIAKSRNVAELTAKIDK